MWGSREKIGMFGRSAMLTVTFALLGVASANAADFTLDPKFGDRGVVRSGLRADSPVGVRVPGGTIVSLRDQNDESHVAKFRLNGKLDRSFGEDGVTPYPWSFQFGRNTKSQVTDILRLADGKLLVISTIIFDPGTENSDYGYIVMRFTPDGQVDKSFGDGGRVIYGRRAALATSRTAVAASRLSGGRILLAGQARIYSERKGWQSVPEVRVLNRDGSMSQRFGKLGHLRLAAPGDRYATNEATDAVRDGDGVLIAVVSGSEKLKVVRLKHHGRLDRSFGRGGRAAFKAPITRCETALSWCGHIATLTKSKKRIYAYLDSGDVVRYDGTGPSGHLFALDRSGRVVRTFGQGGQFTIPFSKKRGGFVATNLVEANGGGVLIAGTYQGRRSSPRLMRVTTRGTIDRSFGERGYLRFDALGRSTITSTLSSSSNRLQLLGTNANQTRLVMSSLVD